MTKTYRINGIDLYESYVDKRGDSIHRPTHEILIDLLEALSDKEECKKNKWCEIFNCDGSCKKNEPKQEECHCGKDGHALNSVNCPVHGYYTVPKQPTSLKEEVILRLKHPTYQTVTVDEAIPMGEEYEANEILKLIQSRVCESCKHKFNYENNN